MVTQARHPILSSGFLIVNNKYLAIAKDTKQNKVSSNKLITLPYEHECVQYYLVKIIVPFCGPDTNGN